METAESLTRLAEGMTDDDLVVKCEEVIRNNINATLACAEALILIRDRRLFRLAGYRTFHAYCRERWGLERWMAYRAIVEGRGYRIIGSRSVPRYVAEEVGKSTLQQRERVLKLLQENPSPTREEVRAARLGRTRREGRADDDDDEGFGHAPESDGRSVSAARRIVTEGDEFFGPLLKTLGDVIQSIRALMSRDCGQGVSQQIERSAVQLRSDVALARPCYCPACSGYGCRQCNNTGWLYQFQALQVRRDQKTAGRKR